MKLSKDPIQHQHNKQIKLHVHFIRNLNIDQVIQVLFFPTEYHVVAFSQSLLHK
jgi:hypothetical protein